MENLKFSLDDDIIDIEWCTLHGHTPPKGRKYRIIIDREKFVVDKECMTGREILMLTGKNPPERFQLRQNVNSCDVDPPFLHVDPPGKRAIIERAK